MEKRVYVYVTSEVNNEKVMSYICPLESMHVKQWDIHVQPKLKQWTIHVQPKLLQKKGIPGWDWNWGTLLRQSSDGFRCFCLILDEEGKDVPNGMVAVSTSHKESIHEPEMARNIIQVKFLASSHESFDCIEARKKYKHVGSALLDRILLLSSELDTVVTGKIILDAIPTAVDFYEKYGMVHTGVIRGNYGACWYDRMELQESVGKSKLQRLFS